MNKTITTPNGHNVRVWHGREYINGPDKRLRGWFWALVTETGEGDPSGPFKTEAEATAFANDVL